MADAYKCDRCGKYVDGEPKDKIKFSDENGAFRPTISSSRDLCPDCFAGLKKWMANEKEVHIKGRDCPKCAYNTGNILCNLSSPTCAECKKALGLDSCPCNSTYAHDGEPCPNFREA